MNPSIEVRGDEIGIVVEGRILGPDQVTDQQITNLGPTFVSEFQDHCALLRRALQKEAIAVAEDFNKLRIWARRAKAFAAQLSQWNDRLGDLVTPGLRTIENGMAADVDFVLSEINSTKSHSDPADWWRRDESEQ